MNKLFNIVIEIIYWILFFLSPFLAFTIIAVIFYLNNPSNHWLPVTLLIIGVISGIVLAERIRRKHGTANYMGTLWGNAESTENEPNKKD